MIEQQDAGPQRVGRRARQWMIALAVIALAAVGALVYMLAGQHRAPGPSGTGSAAAVAPTSATSAVPTFEMQGAFDIFIDPGSTTLKNNQACKGTGPNGESIGAGTPVRVFNQAGAQVAVADLGNGAFQRTPIGSACVFTLDVPVVPDGLPNYGVEVGTYGVHQVSSTQAHSNVFLSEGP